MESLERLAKARRENRRDFIRTLWIVFAVALAALALTGQVSAEDQRGEGFLENRPRWFAMTKVTERHYRTNYAVATYTGSGVWLSDNMVLTCWHNYRDTWNQQQRRHTHAIVDHNGNEYTNVTVVAKDSGADLMLVRVNGPVKDHGFCAVSSAPESEGFVTCYGMHTDGVKFRWTQGKVLLNDNGHARRRMIRQSKRRIAHVTDALVVQGMSGGPAFDDEGYLQGVNVGHSGGETQMISLSVIQSFLDRAIPTE